MAARKKSKNRKSKTKARKTSRAVAKRAASARKAKRPVAKRSTAKARKATPRTKAKKGGGTRKSPRKDVYGEGNYTATRAFDKAQTNFVKKNKSRIPEMGKKAEKALEGAKGPALREAEQQAASHGREDEAA